MRKARFIHNEPSVFVRTVNRRVNDYFRQEGISKHASTWMITKLVICFALYLSLYFIIILDIPASVYIIPIVLLFGLSCALVGFNVAHDASHGALFNSNKLNLVFSYSFELIGISSYAWHVKHNVVHHNNPNLQRGDFDIEGGPILRFSPADKRLFFHRFQHIYAPFVYLLLSLAMLFFLDFKVVFGTKRENIDGKKHPASQKIIFILAKVLYLFLMIGLPVIMLDYLWWQVVLGFLVMHFTLSILLAIILIPAHVFENTEYPVTESDGRIMGDWSLYQMRTTMDYSRKSRICNFLFGGLNINVVHHLFPKICHVHLMRVSDIVRETADEYGITYHNKSIWGAMRSHFAELRNLGRRS